MNDAPTDDRCTAWIACHDCDLLLDRPRVAPGHVARCPRCAAVLVRGRTRAFERGLAWALAGLVCFALANAFPFLSFGLEGRTEAMTITAGAIGLWQGGYPALAALVFGSSVVVPLLVLVTQIVVAGRLHRKRPLGSLGRALRWLLPLQPWAMLEVYLLGVLVAVVKLAQMASVGLGVGFYAFLGLVLATSAVASLLDPREVWDRAEATS